MRKTARISLPDFRQPNENAISVIKAFAEKWNEANPNAVLEYDWGGWDLFLKKETFYLYSIAIKEFKKLKKEFDIYFNHHVEKHYEEADYLAADFIEFSAGQIISDNPFVLNLEEISPSGGRCSKCGAWYALTHTTVPSPLLIDESLLKNPTDEGTIPDQEIWDIVYANTHYLISPRFKQLLEANDIKGYILGPAISHQTNKTSEKVYQFFANKSILITALPEGETVQPFCDKCSTAHVPYEYDFAIRKEWVGDDDFFAQDAYKGTCLHMSNRVFKLVREHQLTGFSPKAVVAAV